MKFKQIICLWLIGYLLLPAQCWSQLTAVPPAGLQTQPTDKSKLEEQAQFYLQRIGPQLTTPSISGQLPPQQTPLPAPAPETAKVLTTAPRQPEEISAAEKRAAEYGLNVKQFGYSFFFRPPETFLPVQAVPVGPGYIIGPGDSIKILIWGSVQGEYSLMVDRNGQIDIPKVGAVHVSGLSYKQLREVMDREFARQFNNFQMNVTLDNLRTILVYVVGQARFPGSYAVSSLSTLISALFAAGGPSKSGSMRNIQVRRGNKVIAHFDMYNFLFKGDKSKDVRLQSEDVIFIPPIGPLAAIGAPAEEIVGVAAGEGRAERVSVKTEQPQIGSLGQPQVGGLMTQPGQPQVGSSMTQPGQPQVGSSMTQPGQPQVGGPMTQPGQLQVGGLMTQPGQPQVGGPIKVPGIYELKNEKTLTDLINLAGGLADTAFKGRVQVLRIQQHREMVLFEDDLNKVLTGRVRDIALVDGDFVKIFRVPGVVERIVRLAGAVKKPGEFGFHDNMRIKDLIQYAGGLLLEANQQEAEITRVTITPQGPETSRLYISPRRALSGAPRDNILLKPNDYVFIRSVPDWTLYTLVRIEGEIKFPGNYAVKKGETLSSVLARAGGFTNKAYTKGAIFTRDSVRRMQAEQLKQIVDRLEAELYTTSATRAEGSIDKEDAERQKLISLQQQKFIAKMRTIMPLGRVVLRIDDPERLRGTPNDLELQAGDSLFVPQIQQSVNVMGSVMSPTAVVYSPYLTARDYLAKAGGPTRSADVRHMYVIKANGSAVSDRGFFGSGLSGARLDPGDTIVVPEDFERVVWLKQFKDIATILGQIALTAGVVLVGLKR
jgi:protein involved in polysaccharide export with SLBB domain